MTVNEFNTELMGKSSECVKEYAYMLLKQLQH
jgi:hypothetical protein